MAIYTRSGDQGNTSNFDKSRVSKSDQKIITIGTIDELNSSLGLAASLLNDATLQRLIELVQRDLFQLGSHISGLQEIGITQERVAMLESQIDEWDTTLARLTNFILPGGSPAASATHVARSVSRRAEREIVRYHHEQHPLDPVILQYINRLSDWLFTLARYINLLEGTPEKLWEGYRVSVP